MSKQINDYELGEIANAIIAGHPTIAVWPAATGATEMWKTDPKVVAVRVAREKLQELQDAYLQAMTDCGKAVAAFYDVAVTSEADNEFGDAPLMGFGPSRPSQSMPAIFDEYDESGDWEHPEQ